MYMYISLQYKDTVNVAHMYLVYIMYGRNCFPRGTCGYEFDFWFYIFDLHDT